jgi:hypothetical protein
MTGRQDDRMKDRQRILDEYMINICLGYFVCVCVKANRGDKRTRRVRDRGFVKFERSRRYRDRYRCQEKNSRRGRACDLVFRDPPTLRTRARSLFAVRDSPPPHNA